MSRSRSVTREYLEALLIAIIFATFARTYVVQAFKIPTGSMEPDLLVGDHLLVNKFIYGPHLFPWMEKILPERGLRRGDVVVFKFPQDPTRDFIKRCVALPGDTIEIVNKKVFINGREVDDSAYAYHFDSRIYPRSIFLSDTFRRRDNFGPFTVPSGYYFMMGDNRDNSDDSRYWGPVPRDYIMGRALLVYWSFAGREEESIAWPGWKGKLEQLAGVASHFFSRTRWHRFFHLVR